MSTASNELAPSQSFAHSAEVPIQHLRPAADHEAATHVNAIVALVWPYSSSSRSLSLLLADPDVRLRKTKGQVKVTFGGSNAKAVARTHVGIGDTVLLSLDGAQWANSTEDVATPGKKITWDLVYHGRLAIQVRTIALSPWSRQMID